MHTRTLTPRSSAVVVLAPGEEVVATLTDLARRDGVRAASLSAIGVFSDARIGYLDPATNAYVEFDVNESTEVLGMTGSIVLNHGQPEVHAHVALGTADTSVRGGHLIAAHVHPTLEVFLDVYDTAVERRLDEATHQELIAPEGS